MPLALIITHILIALRFKALRLSCLRQNAEKNMTRSFDGVHCQLQVLSLQSP